MIKLIWITPDAEQLIGYMARVSNPANQDNENIDGLLKYMIRNEHWSPFEMASACFEINTTRDIGRQILRHRSFSFQEFCVAATTQITLELPNSERRGKRAAYKRTIEHLYRLQEVNQLPKFVRVFDEQTKTFVRAGIREIFKTGVKPVFQLTLANGKSIDCTKEHKLLTTDGFMPLEEAIGLRVINGRALMEKPDTAIACNGEPAYASAEWLSGAKKRAIESGRGLAGIAEEAGVTTHTIRKHLKRSGLQFSKKEVAKYSPIWNKGLSGYRNRPHSAETIAKMRRSARRGAASNLWRGGADRAERLRIADWCAAHRTDFMRAANYACNRCGSNERLEMHHILTVAERPDLAMEPSNIEVLCKKCHRDHHNINGDLKMWRQKSAGNTLTIHWSKVESIEYLGEQETYDMEVNHASHNYVANGIVTHNSQRYEDVSKLPPVEFRECRMQDTKNRQNSVATEDDWVAEQWARWQLSIYKDATETYKAALDLGIAKEQARALLPEGLTPSRMYMSGTLRSWMHYVKLRSDPATQKEHRLIAQEIGRELEKQVPTIWSAWEGV